MSITLGPNYQQQFAYSGLLRQPRCTPNSSALQRENFTRARWFPLLFDKRTNGTLGGIFNTGAQILQGIMRKIHLGLDTNQEQIRAGLNTLSQAHTYKPSTWETEAGRSVQFQGQAVQMVSSRLASQTLSQKLGNRQVDRQIRPPSIHPSLQLQQPNILLLNRILLAP